MHNKIIIYNTGGHCSTYTEMAERLSLTNWEWNRGMNKGEYKIIAQHNNYLGIEAPNGNQHIYSTEYPTEFNIIPMTNCEEEYAL